MRYLQLLFKLWRWAILIAGWLSSAIFTAIASVCRFVTDVKPLKLQLGEIKAPKVTINHIHSILGLCGNMQQRLIAASKAIFRQAWSEIQWKRPKDCKGRRQTNNLRFLPQQWMVLTVTIMLTPWRVGMHLSASHVKWHDFDSQFGPSRLWQRKP